MMMNETLDLTIKIYKRTLILTLAIALISIFFVNDYISFIYGLVFGTLIALLNFTLLAKTMEKAAQMSPEKAKVYATSRYFIRYTIYGIVLYVSIIADYINVIGTIIGLLTIKVVILIVHAFNDKTYYKNIFKRKNKS